MHVMTVILFMFANNDIIISDSPENYGLLLGIAWPSPFGGGGGFEKY